MSKVDEEFVVNNVYVEEDDDMFVFTTNCREAAAILDKLCESANITENEGEINGFHYQACIVKK